MIPRVHVGRITLPALCHMVSVFVPDVVSSMVAVFDTYLYTYLHVVGQQQLFAKNSVRVLVAGCSTASL